MFFVFAIFFFEIVKWAELKLPGWVCQLTVTFYITQWDMLVVFIAAPRSLTYQLADVYPQAAYTLAIMTLCQPYNGGINSIDILDYNPDKYCTPMFGILPVPKAST